MYRNYPCSVVAHRKIMVLISSPGGEPCFRMMMWGTFCVIVQLSVRSGFIVDTYLVLHLTVDTRWSPLEGPSLT